MANLTVMSLCWPFYICPYRNGSLILLDTIDKCFLTAHHLQGMDSRPFRQVDYSKYLSAMTSHTLTGMKKKIQQVFKILIRIIFIITNEFNNFVKFLQ